MSLVERKPPTSYEGGPYTDDQDDVFKSERDTHIERSTTDISIENKFRNFARHYIVGQLRKKGFESLADKHEISKPDETEDAFRHTLHHLAGNLAEERERQFEDILTKLELTDANLSESYHVIVTEMFIDGVNWGRILAFMVFSGALAVHCAREGMEGRVGDVIRWTEDSLEKMVLPWAVDQGGWRAFLDHFDAGTWTIDPPQCILAGILIVLVGGFYLLKKLF